MCVISSYLVTCPHLITFDELQTPNTQRCLTAWELGYFFSFPLMQSAIMTLEYRGACFQGQSEVNLAALYMQASCLIGLKCTITITSLLCIKYTNSSINLYAIYKMKELGHMRMHLKSWSMCEY